MVRVGPDLPAPAPTIRLSSESLPLRRTRGRADESRRDRGGSVQGLNLHSRVFTLSASLGRLGVQPLSCETLASPLPKGRTDVSSSRHTIFM